MRIISPVLYFVLAPFIGGLLEGFERKISARMQGRTGPSVWQPFYDVKKLLCKELFVVNNLQGVLVMCYLVIIVACGVMFYAGLDLLMIFFVLTTAGIFLVLVGSCTNSPYSSLGAQREIMQMMAYEPMVLLTAVGFYMATGTFKVSQIVHGETMAVCYLPGVLVAFLFILTIKMRKSPFDLSTSHHAHQEMVKGVTTEIVGKYLAVIEIAEWYENVFLLSIIGLFFVKGTSIAGIICSIVGALVAWFIEILIGNTSARVTWKIMLRSAWAVTLVFGGLNLLILNLR